MRDLNDLDPLPKLGRGKSGARLSARLTEAFRLPPSERLKKEWAGQDLKEAGEDWQPYKRDGQIVPHTYINGQGKLKTEGYQPPEPPETDIPIPCVIETFEEELARKVAQLKADMEAAAYWEPHAAIQSWPWKIERPRHEWITDTLKRAEPQTQPASQMEPPSTGETWVPYSGREFWEADWKPAT
jgi:hypothetical protein